MTAVILTIHTLLVMALVGVVLLQRSEGGALGIGGGGGGVMSGRGAANALTRTTTILGACFFITSMSLALLADRGTTQEDVIRSITGQEGAPASEGGLTRDALEDLLGAEPSAETPEAETTPIIPAAPEEPVADEAATTEEDDAPVIPE